MEEDFSLLESIVKKNIAGISQPAEFDWEKFVSEMEVGFTELGFREQSAGGVDNILIIRVDAAGDFILTAPAIAEVRRNFPFAKITLMCSKRNLNLAEKCPYVNEVILFSVKCRDAENPVELLPVLTEFAKKNLWHRRLQLVFNFKSYPKMIHHCLAYLSGAKERVGFISGAQFIVSDDLLAKEDNYTYNLLSRPTVYPKTVTHDVERSLYLLKSLGKQIQTTAVETWYSYAEILEARKLLQCFDKNSFKVAVGIGGSENEKIYPKEMLLKVLQSLVQQGADLIFLGGSKERNDAKFLQDKLPKENILNLCELNIRWALTVAIISQADMYLGNDTGVMHAAATCHVPVVEMTREAKNRPAIFNLISSYNRFIPWQVEQIGLRPIPIGACAGRAKRFSSSTCINIGKAHCITQIKPEEVIAACKKMTDFIKTAKKIGGFPVLKKIKPISGAKTLADFKRNKNFADVELEIIFAGNFNFVKGFKENQEMTEDFSLLEKIVNKNILETDNPDNVNWKKFVTEMEQGFTELGFREQSTGGGVDNILITRFQFYGAGDFVLMTPAIREIRRNFPHAKITLTILGRLHSLAERCPYVNEVIINNIPGASDQVSLLRNMTEFCNQHFWHKRYRLAIVLKGTTDWIPHLYLYLSGARERVNFVHLADRIYTDTVRPKDRSPSYLFLTHPVLYPKNIIHEAERNLYLLKAYGLQVRSNHAELWYETSDLYQARKILGNFGKNKVRVVVAVGTSGAQRENRYPIEQYLKAFKKMIELGAAIIISGGSAEKKSAEFLQNNLPSNAVLNLCELGLTWNTTAAIIAQSDTYIGNDTGPLHLSVACRKPVIALYRDAKYRPALYNGVSSYFRFFPFQNYAIPLQPKKNSTMHIPAFMKARCIV